MDVIVFELGARRCAVDLRLVQEVITLGPVTPVPTAPLVVAGAINVHGHVVALLDLGALAGATPATPLEGEIGILVEVQGTRAVLHVSRVQEVATVAAPPTSATAGAPGLPGVLVESTRGTLLLVDLPEIVEQAVTEVAAAAARILPHRRRDAAGRESSRPEASGGPGGFTPLGGSGHAGQPPPSREGKP